MKSFNISRFRNVLAYFGSMNRKRYVTIASVVVILATLITIMKYHELGAVTGISAIVSMSGFSTGLLAGTVFCCMMVPNTKRNSDELSRLLMLPASNLEKFIAALLMNVLVPTFIIWLASGLCALVLEHQVAYSEITSALRNADPLGFFASFASCLLLYSHCILVGMVLSRAKWVAAMACVVIYVIVISTLVIKCHMAHWLADDRWGLTPEEAGYALFSFMTLVAIAFLAIAYWRFCRLQGKVGRLLCV